VAFGITELSIRAVCQPYTPAALYCPERFSESNRNEDQKIFLGSRARPECKADEFTAISYSIV
jgi:hypothetical protein